MSKNAEGWIRHRGGKCPVEAGVKVDYRMRDGEIDCFGHEAGRLQWGHEPDDCDIMAYRLHKPAEQVEACSKPDPRDSAKRDSDYVCWMRDRITEIDATTQALTAERAELVQKLASEGFALIGREPGAPIGLPRDEWKVGDLVMLKCKSPKTDMPAGKPLPITEFDGSSFGQDVKVDGFYFPMVSDLTWHSRPSA